MCTFEAEAWFKADKMIEGLMLIPSVIFLGLSQVSKTVLNGLGKQKTLMITSIIDGSVVLYLPISWCGASASMASF